MWYLWWSKEIHDRIFRYQIYTSSESVWGRVFVRKVKVTKIKTPHLRVLTVTILLYIDI